jgi:hypothetical protein
MIPDSPINLADVPSVTSATQIGLSWDEAVFNGGSSVIDYRVWYSTDGTSFSVVQAGITTKVFTVGSLASGKSYHFKV